MSTLILVTFFEQIFYSEISDIFTLIEIICTSEAFCLCGAFCMYASREILIKGTYFTLNHTP